MFLNENDLRRVIMDEVHNSTYTIHLSATKIYQDMKQVYWWDGMKKDVDDYISQCLACQQVKAENKKSTRLFQ